MLEASQSEGLEWGRRASEPAESASAKGSRELDHEKKEVFVC